MLAVGRQDRLPDARRIARLCTYIHVKLAENDEKYFERPHPEDEAAICALLGETSRQTHPDSPPQPLPVARELKAVELRAEKEFGLELYISSELNGRLRLYTDDAFRASMLRLYRDRIRPALKNHSSR